MLPRVEMLLDKGYEVLYLTEYLDEFVIKILNQYQELRHSCDKGKQSLVKFTKTNLCVFPRL